MNIDAVSEKHKVSFVFPCLNESATLEHCICQAQAVIDTLKIPGEIIVADNGSVDNSCQIAAHLGARIVRVGQRGYGAALIGGCSAAAGQWIVMADADASYDPYESLPMIKWLCQGVDLVVGSRYKGKILPGAMPWKNRFIGNPLLTGALNLLYRSGFSDTQCGMRAFTRQAFDHMELSSPGMEFASEMIIKATLLGMARREVPITYYPDGRGRTPHLRPWRDGLRHLQLLSRLIPEMRKTRMSGA